MSERISTRPVRSPEIRESKKLSKRVKNWITAHPKLLNITGIVVIVLAVLCGVFYGGFRYGVSWQKKSTQQTKNPYASLSEEQRKSLENRTVALGNITKVSATSIEVKTTAGATSTFVINKDTVINDSKLKVIKVDALKVGDKVIVTGTKSDKTATATRIRLQAAPTKK